MKEQVADILKSKMALEKCDPDVMPYFTDYYWIPKDEVANLAQEILNLFKEVVDKLTVMDDEELRNHLTVNDCLNLYDEEGIIGLVEKVRDVSREAQLQHTKKQLLDLMGE